MKKSNNVKTGSNLELNKASYDNRLWLVARNENMSRRAFIDDIAKTIYDFHHEGGIIRCGNTGRIWPIPDVYEVMGEDGRWLSYWLESEDGRPKRKPTSMTLERRRLIDLRYRIKMVNMAKKFNL
jgi:hypothetical protein